MFSPNSAILEKFTVSIGTYQMEIQDTCNFNCLCLCRYHPQPVERADHPDVHTVLTTLFCESQQPRQQPTKQPMPQRTIHQSRRCLARHLRFASTHTVCLHNRHNVWWSNCIASCKTHTNRYDVRRIDVLTRQNGWLVVRTPNVTNPLRQPTNSRHGISDAEFFRTQISSSRITGHAKRFLIVQPATDDIRCSLI